MRGGVRRRRRRRGVRRAQNIVVENGEWRLEMARQRDAEASGRGGDSLERDTLDEVLAVAGVERALPAERQRDRARGRGGRGEQLVELRVRLASCCLARARSRAIAVGGGGGRRSCGGGGTRGLRAAGGLAVRLGAARAARGAAHEHLPNGARWQQVHRLRRAPAEHTQEKAVQR